MTDTGTSAHKLWIEERRLSAGGSDIAGILGISRYATPFTVWGDKLGLLPEKEDSEAMRQGRELEDYVAYRFTEHTGLTVRRDRRQMHNPRYPYAHANIDRRITGMSAGLECKTCSPFRQGEFGEFEYPQEYYAQCLHYLAVTGWDVWYLAVLIFGSSFTVYEIRREAVQDEIDALEASVTEFWESYVLTGNPPPMDGEEATTKALNSMFSTAIDGSADLNHMESHCIEIAALKGQIEILEQAQELHRQEIKLAMGENMRAECGAWVANWKPRKDGVRVFTLKLK